jgi:hypothetical protein
LAIGTVKIAAKHAEGIGERARKYVVEGLLLNRIELWVNYVTPRNIKLAVPIKPNLANPSEAHWDRTAVRTCGAPDPIAIQGIPQRTFSG